MTNDEKRAIQMRELHLKEQGLPVTPWRLAGETEQKKWLAKARAESPNGTLATTPRRTTAISPAHADQRAAVAGRPCVVLDKDDACSGPIDPAHLVDRSLGGDDRPLAVVPMCRHHHDLYDNGQLSVLEHLEPVYREQVAYAVQLLGIVGALQRLTNERWSPDREQEQAA